MLTDKIRNFINENRMLERGDRIIVAVSGGADSMCLLHSLSVLRGELGTELRAFHVNHGLRGNESDADERFVEAACERLGVEFKSVSVDVTGLVEEKKLSTEEAARFLRYKAFEDEAVSWERESGGRIRIAVAHNREDNAETILMQMARGSGLKGISGMSPVRDRIIRPLLTIGRSEIEEYLISTKETWVTDRTNSGNDYTRNRIRHNILPLLSSEVNAGAVDNINKAGRLVGQAYDYIIAEAEKLLDANGQRDGDIYLISVNKLREVPAIIRTYMIRAAVERINATMKDITATHIEDIAALINSETGKRIDLPYGLLAEREYENIKISHGKNRQNPVMEEALLKDLFTFEILDYHGEEIPESQYVKWFDYGKIVVPMDIRYRRPDDKIVIKSGSKTVREFMTDAKIPKESRDRIPVVTCGDDVVWIVGYRISEKYKICEGTKKILSIKFKKEVWA